MATATISAATLAALGVLALIIWVLVYLKYKKEERPHVFTRQKVWHRNLRIVGLTLLGLSVATYLGLH
jgi:membrane protease YdiL (CAAX protease family)